MLTNINSVQKLNDLLSYTCSLCLWSWCELLFLYLYVDGAAEQRAEIQSFPDGGEQEGLINIQVVALCDSSGEILKSLDGPTSAQSFIRAVHPAERVWLNNVWTYCAVVSLVSKKTNWTEHVHF